MTGILPSWNGLTLYNGIPLEAERVLMFSLDHGSGISSSTEQPDLLKMVQLSRWNVKTACCLVPLRTTYEHLPIQLLVLSATGKSFSFSARKGFPAMGGTISAIRTLPCPFGAKQLSCTSEHPSFGRSVQTTRSKLCAGCSSPPI